MNAELFHALEMLEREKGIPVSDDKALLQLLEDLGS